MKKGKKHAKRSHVSASHVVHRKSNFHQPVPFIAVIATVVLVVLGLGVWLQSAVAQIAR